MSQLSQAQALQEQSNQILAEAGRNLAALGARFQAGDLDREAYEKESAAVQGQIDVGLDLQAQAGRLNTVDRSAVGGTNPNAGRDAAEAHVDRVESGDPVYLRAMGNGEAPSGAPPGTTSLHSQYSQTLGLEGLRRSVDHDKDLRPEILLGAKRMGVEPYQFGIARGEVRQAMNSYLRELCFARRDGRPFALDKRSVAVLAANRGISLSAQDVKFLTGRGPRPRISPEVHLSSSYVDRDFGFLIEEEILNEAITKVRDRIFITERARTISTTAGQVALPTRELHVGLKKARDHVGKVDRSGPITIRDILGRQWFTPHTHMETVLIPKNVLEDSTGDPVGYMSDEIAKDEAERQEMEFLTGSGNGEAYGIFTAGALLEGKGHGGTGADFEAGVLRTFPTEVRFAVSSNFSWLAPRPFYRRIVGFREESGASENTGGFMFEFSEQPGRPPTIDGHSLLISEFYPDHFDGTPLPGSDVNQTTDAGDPLALLIDFSGYMIVRRKKFYAMEREA
jgi:HK97 family phage major capsid protein